MNAARTGLKECRDVGEVRRMITRWCDLYRARAEMSETGGVVFPAFLSLHSKEMSRGVQALPLFS